MSSTSNVPGVYREEVSLRPDPKLTTGIAGFVGFAAPAGAAKAVSPVALSRQDDFAGRVRAVTDGYLAAAVAGLFENGGLRRYVGAASGKPADGDVQKALTDALESLAPVGDIDLVAIPDAMTLYKPGMVYAGSALEQLQVALLKHCDRNAGRMAILDALPAPTKAVIEQRRWVTAGMGEPVNGALYYPWIKTYEGRLVPPCGHVTGIYARSDARAGIFKAPANEEIRGALDLGVLVSRTGDQDVTEPIVPDQEALNPEGVNCLRTFPGRGIRVWGARTLSRDPDWRYVNVRRLFLT